MRKRIILAIETSCDETAAAVIENGTKMLASAVASSQELHKKTGGIIPETAAREQLRCMIPILRETLIQFCPENKNNLPKSLEKIDALAVTYGPGLIGSLLIGVETAKSLSYITKKPLIAINHLHGHILANWLEKKPHQFPSLPGVALIASGGHTELVLTQKKDNQLVFQWLGGTRDDAAGECFDKCARVLDMSYPGGPAIAKASEKVKDKEQFSLPRPMIHQKNLDFSFSGLKTAVVYKVRQLKKNKQWQQKTKNNLAWEIQEAISDVLVEKTIWAARKYQAKSILLGGGVTANQVLREKLKEKRQQFDLFIPPIKLCVDNAAMIGAAAYFIGQTTPWQKIKAEPGLKILHTAEV